MRLDWTGNLFIDQQEIADIVRGCATEVDYAHRGSQDCAALRAALSDWLGIPAELVAVGAGSSQVIDGLVAISECPRVIDVVPNYYGVRRAAERHGREYVPVPVRAPGELVDALQMAGADKQSVVFLSSPRNPFGWSVPIATLEELCKSLDSPLVIDEAYADFTSVTAIPLLAKYERLTVVRTFSKVFGLANLRIGYAASQASGPRLRDRWLLPYCVGALQEAVAVALLRDPSLIVASVGRLREARAAFDAALAAQPRIPCWRSEASYACVESINAALVRRELQDLGIHVARLAELEGHQGSWPDGIRVTMAPWSALVPVVEALRRAQDRASRNESKWGV